MLPGWHSVSTRGLAALGKVRFMSCQRTRASAPIPPRLVQSWWEYWERWTRATAETCSFITASLACSAMKRSASQVHPKRRRNCYILEKLLIYFLCCFFTTQPLVACFKSCLPLVSFQRCSSGRTALMTSSLVCTMKHRASLFSTRRGCWRPVLTTLSAIPTCPASAPSPSSSSSKARYAHTSPSVRVYFLVFKVCACLLGRRCVTLHLFWL